MQIKTKENQEKHGDGREEWTIHLEGGTVHTYYGNRYSFVFPSPDCNRSHKEEKAQVETNVYAGQTTSTVLNKKKVKEIKKEKNGWNHSELLQKDGEWKWRGKGDTYCM